MSPAAFRREGPGSVPAARRELQVLRQVEHVERGDGDDTAEEQRHGLRLRPLTHPLLSI